MTLPVIVVGGGGHALVVIEALRLVGAEIAGIADPGGAAAARAFGLTVLGGDDAVFVLGPDQVQLANGIGSIEAMDRRGALFRRFTARGYRFATVLHPRAVIGTGVVLEQGVQVMAGAIIQCFSKIGADTIVNTAAAIDHGCTIGESCHIAPGATLCGDVTLGERCHIGAGATIIQGLSIGAGSLVAAGAVVTRDLPAGSRYIPGR